MRKVRRCQAAIGRDPEGEWQIVQCPNRARYEQAPYLLLRRGTVMIPVCGVHRRSSWLAKYIGGGDRAPVASWKLVRRLD